VPLASSTLSHSLMCCVSATSVLGQHGRPCVAIIEATRVMTVIAAETSAQEATTVRDSTALHVKDVVDRAALA
jgi:hypothetical protein